MGPPLIVCVKVGTKYGAEYVNRLAAMVRRHTSTPYEFLCLTDDRAGVDCASAPIDCEYPGWWAKLVLFKPHPALAARRVIFLDLDTVIVGNIDFLLDYQGPFAILRDFYRPNGYGSAVMSIAPGYGCAIWQKLAEHPKLWMAEFAGDQDFIRMCVDGADLWQDLYPSKIVSYKVHCGQGIPEGTVVVCFHGEPKPPDLKPENSIRGIWEGACSSFAAEVVRPA